MKIKLICSSDQFAEDNNYRNFFVVEVDGETKANFLDGKPEDANISRDFSDVLEIPDLMQLAYDAGKAGEDFEIEECESDDFV